MKIDFTHYLTEQTLEETIQVLDDMMLLLVLHIEENGMNENLSHQYLTLRNLRDTFRNQTSNKET